MSEHPDDLPKTADEWAVYWADIRNAAAISTAYAVTGIAGLIASHLVLTQSRAGIALALAAALLGYLSAIAHAYRLGNWGFVIGGAACAVGSAVILFI